VDGTLDACRKLGITLIAYSPLGMGALTGKYSATHRAGGFFRRILPNFSRKAMDAVQPVIHLLRQIGERYSKTPSQVALRWLIENPLVLPIVGAKNGKQATENAGALSFSLTSEEVELLSQATLLNVTDRKMVRKMDYKCPFHQQLIYVTIVLFLPYGIVGTWRLKSFEIKQGWDRLSKMFSK